MVLSNNLTFDCDHKSECRKGSQLCEHITLPVSTMKAKLSNPKIVNSKCG